MDHDEGNAGEATFAAPRSGAVLVAALTLGGLAFSLLQVDGRARPSGDRPGPFRIAGRPGWIVTGYLLGGRDATPIAGRMGDLWEAARS